MDKTTEEDLIKLQAEVWPKLVEKVLDILDDWSMCFGSISNLEIVLSRKTYISQEDLENLIKEKEATNG